MLPTTAEELDDALAAPQALIFKHSTLCPVSGLALQEVMALADAHPDLPIHLVDVHSQRHLSNQLADTLGVRHESPQALIVRHGEVVWHASHFGVMRERMERILREEA
ncbi:MAG TPA: bacillithiol system redox-active protein YtxJ [Gemmatimonadales bacterium]